MAGKTVVVSGCEVLTCKCAHPFQDQHYGKGRRVHNACKAKSGGLEYRCTVCLNVRGGNPQAQPEEKEAK